MFPIRDTIRSYKTPVINYIIIAANVAAFLFELQFGTVDFERFIRTWGLVPARLFSGDLLSWLTIFSSMFLHGGWLHIISNMWTLFIFGDNVEDRMGSLRYLFFYLGSGVAAGLLQAFIMPGSQVPSVGASGAIAGVMAAYFIFFPRARVVTLVPLFFFITFVEIPAVIYLGFWFVSQLFSGVFSLGAQASMGGIAWWAHIGGFVFGLITARMFRQRQPESYMDIYQPWNR